MDKWRLDKPNMSEKTQTTKKQHYVPREILRNFSSDSKKKSISMFYLKENSIKEKVKLYNQACETFFLW